MVSSQLPQLLPSAPVTKSAKYHLSPVGNQSQGNQGRPIW